MRRRVRRPSEPDILRWIAHGRGAGFKSAYLPWFEVQDIPSRGKSRKVPWPTVGRLLHFLSHGEFLTFLWLAYSRRLIDYREQFPLWPREVVMGLAAQMGIAYPVYRGTTVPFVMTTDGLATELTTGGLRLVAIYVKRSQDLDSCYRTLELLELERAFWALQGVRLVVFTEREFSKNVAVNLQWLYPGVSLSRHLQDRNLHLAFLDCAASFPWASAPMDDALLRIGRSVGLPGEDAYEFFRYSAWHRSLEVDMERRLRPCDPVHVLTVRHVSSLGDGLRKAA